MALHSDTAIYKTTYDLSLLVTRLVSEMPRNYRADFGKDLRRDCLGLVRLIYRANTVKDKKEILSVLREEIESVNLSIRLAAGLKLISLPQQAQAILLIDSAGKQATGWYQSSEKTLVAPSLRR